MTHSSRLGGEGVGNKNGSRRKKNGTGGSEVHNTKNRKGVGCRCSETKGKIVRAVKVVRSLGPG